ncbi:uncharacterized protein [Nicotiana sylvestris]|uniref:uncharacterized protein n=1 Tax=Nicotiana sylvestris TaxID=4096 RepID=UPI00388CDB72
MYIPPSEREELRYQFEQLEKSQMFVTDYEAKTYELSCHALMILPTDAEKVRRFVVGLHSDIRANMARDVEIGTPYQLVVEIALRIKGYHLRGSTYSYVSSLFAHFQDIPHEPLGTPVHMSTFVGDYVVVDRIYRSCVVTLCGFKTRADLMLLDMTDFEVILGMDWLSPYHTVLDCHAKTVTLAMPELPRLEWKGSSVNTSSRVVSFLKARHMVGNGFLAYLAYVRDTTTDPPTIDSVPVVQEFSDVFPSNLPGMPPNFDIDFCIDLPPGTQHISIPSYRMAPKELKELKEQLEELLAKGFVRPNGFSSIVSPLTRLTQNGAPFRWSDDCEASFQKLKTALTTAAVLVLPSGSGMYTINARQFNDPHLVVLRETVLQGSAKEVSIGEDGVLRLKGRLCVPNVDGLRERILDEAHSSRLTKSSHFIPVATTYTSKRKKGKLSPRFIGPFEVLRRVGEVAYELTLPPRMLGVHPIFHVSMLRRYHADLSHVLDFSTIQLDESLGYKEEPVAIIERQDRQLRSKKISTVKVQWRGQPVEEGTWES